MTHLPTGAAPATLAAAAMVPATAAPSELVPPHPSVTLDPWPSLRLFGDEDLGGLLPGTATWVPYIWTRMHVYRIHKIHLSFAKAISNLRF